MDIIRRNTDYALRAMVELAGNFGREPVSAKQLAARQEIPYQLACKLLQRLNKSGIIKSSMGPGGGFKLRKRPASITALEVVEAIQGPIRLNRCLFAKNSCRFSKHCKISPELARLQKRINEFLGGLTLQKLSIEKKPELNAKTKRVRRKK